MKFLYHLVAGALSLICISNASLAESTLERQIEELKQASQLLAAYEITLEDEESTLPEPIWMLDGDDDPYVTNGQVLRTRLLGLISISRAIGLDELAEAQLP